MSFIRKDVVGKLVSQKNNIGIVIKHIPEEMNSDFSFGYVDIYWFGVKSIVSYDLYFIKVGDFRVIE